MDEDRSERGPYLCETCFDVMTSRFIVADGLEQAQCATCAGAPVPKPRLVGVDPRLYEAALLLLTKCRDAVGG